jgi:hypothetical protein
MDGLTLLVVPALAIALLAAGHAAHGGQPPARVAGGVVTAARVRHAGELARILRACRGPGPPEWRRRTPVVDRRIGRRRTLSFRSADGRFVASCDSIGVPVEGRLWCASSTGTLYGGRLRDPRLTLCQRRGRPPVAFAWVTPRRGARWVGIEEARRTVLYRVAARLPVRVSSDRHVRLTGSTATFYVRQYDGRGRLLVRQTVAARVAG